ncbi:phage terminase small subunit P27 family [Agathobaculum sp. NTUH-O15-33]|uniref:phage terminase small subunit P27 family n=1 Tax=Agathobaculum sp. NTUH-O15-33 TaxID=3079302 RepID=UPI00295835CC|nr:phage terminase small subunit P27 family [Agathobaculum sp. NTUH-O15-33]WNX85776.1 phage terminase small subunit P27 family [Agathobaculum sp. NTUH-O15-33]
MPAKKPLPRGPDGTVNIKDARKQMKGHRTNKEIEERAKNEVTADAPKRIVPPKYLPDSMHAEFRKIAKQLIDLHIFASLDFDVLARYLIARAAWTRTQANANHAIMAMDLKDSLAWAKAANIYFGQCHACAQALGLSISSRCKLVVPQAPKEEEDAMSKTLRERMERRQKA